MLYIPTNKTLSNYFNQTKDKNSGILLTLKEGYQVCNTCYEPKLLNAFRDTHNDCKDCIKVKRQDKADNKYVSFPLNQEIMIKDLLKRIVYNKKITEEIIDFLKVNTLNKTNPKYPHLSNKAKADYVDIVETVRSLINRDTETIKSIKDGSITNESLVITLRYLRSQKKKYSY